MMRILLLALSLAIAALGGNARAQDWPNRTVRLVVPYAPGGGVSVLAQIIGNKMSEITKQPVVIDNRPGAGGNVGSDAVAKSTPDGYTLLLHTSALASAPALYKTLPFDVVKDFAPVTMVIATQFIIGGTLKHPGANLRDLIADAKARPGAMNYGSSGPGSSLHLFAEIFKSSAGIDLQHIPYRGDAPMITALISGDIQLAFLPQATGLANVQGNQIRGLGVTGTKRMPSLPNVATAREQGVTGLDEGSWNGMWVAAGTPPAIVQAIQQTMAKVLADPQVRDRILSFSQEPVGNSPAEFAAQFKSEMDKFARVVEAAKIPKMD